MTNKFDLKVNPENIEGLIMCIIDNHMEGVNMYIKAGTDLNKLSLNGVVVLDVAITYRRFAIAQMLANAGAFRKNFRIAG